MLLFLSVRAAVTTFYSVGSSIGEDITCIDRLNSCNFANAEAWCARGWVDRVGRMQLGVRESVYSVGVKTKEMI